MQLSQSFPEHLVILHTLTSLALWVSLALLLYTSGVLLREEEIKPVRLDGRQRTRDFFALTKPLIVGLLLITTYGGLVIGMRAWPSLSMTMWTLLGGALAAGGSSALNQYIDRELDKNMQRTAKRPLADGRLTNAEGLAFGLGLTLASYYVLACFVNGLAALLSLAGIIYYVLLYSLWLKKATVQNIVIGGYGQVDENEHTLAQHRRFIVFMFHETFASPVSDVSDLLLRGACHACHSQKTQ